LLVHRAIWLNRDPFFPSEERLKPKGISLFLNRY
jgi:hypothetical protein